MPDTEKTAASASELPPSQKPFIIGGHFRPFRKDATGFLTRQAQLGDISYFRIATQHAYLINNPEMIRDMLVVNAHKFIKGRALQRSKALLGEGLLTSEKEFHLRQRRMIQPAFHRARIAEYAKTMTEYAERFGEKWRDGEVLDIDREMNRLTLQIVGKTLFNADVEDEADKVGTAITSVVDLFNFLLLPFSEWLEKLPLPQSRRFNKSRDTLNSIIYGFIAQRRRENVDRGDLLSMLLLAQDEDDGGVMTDEQVRDEALTLFLAGHETTANMMAWTWYLLSQNPKAESRLHQELNSVLGGRSPTLDDIPNLKFTEAVMAESMRVFPPAWTVGRLVTEEHEFGGFRIPKKALVLASPFVMHRDRRFWDRAGEFLPERWETISVKEAGQRYIYFPFGGGVRRCIGEAFAWTEGILLLATLARKWKLELMPEQKIGLQALMTLRPKFGMRMKAERLN